MKSKKKESSVKKGTKKILNWLEDKE